MRLFRLSVANEESISGTPANIPRFLAQLPQWRNRKLYQAVVDRMSPRLNPLKIAQIAPLVESVPPRLYGGTERVVSWLTEELVAQGHEVTLFASRDSRTAAELYPVVPRSLRLDGIHNSLPYNI